MIIDTSYFFGDLLIPQKSQPTVNADLLGFIKKYEPKFLSELLGYGVYKDFIVGIADVSPAQKWVNLLQGAEYINAYGERSRWQGLIRSVGGSVSIIPNTAFVSIVVGRGQLYDPVASVIGAPVTTTILPPGVSGNFVFQQRGFGPLRRDEYSVSGNTLTLLNGLIFSKDDTYFYLNYDAFSVSADVTGKQSPIANYVYYWWMRTHATTSAGGGETTNTPSAPVSPGNKLAHAWNEMVQWNRELVNYMYSSPDYPTPNGWLWPRYTTWFSMESGQRDNLLTPINTLGL